VVAALLAAPWLAYQTWYDPPANRLLKWHLAGVVPIDPRSTSETLATAYRDTPGETLRQNKLNNAHVLFFGSFASVFDVFTTPNRARRVDEFFYVFRSLGILNLAWIVVPIAWLIPRFRPSHGIALYGALALWTLFTLLAWVLLMFGPGTTLLHQGSYAAMLSLYVLAIAGLLSVPRWLGVPVLAWHAAYFAVTWLPYFGSAPLAAFMFVLMAVAVVVIGITVVRADSTSAPTETT
jgi:hypothetical protein